MIFSSIDLNKENLEEFLDSLPEIKKCKFNGVEICLWEDMNKYANKIKEGLANNQLESNVHNDLMRAESGFNDSMEKLASSLDFYKKIRANFFITHPIKPYLLNLSSSKLLFDDFKDNVLVENVKDIRLPQLQFLNKPLVLDIGNTIKNGEFNNLDKYLNIKWMHIHDIKDNQDHLPLGHGQLDLISVLKIFPDLGKTIELGNKFRKWSELKEDYVQSIDYLNNSLIYCKSFGKNIRLKHLYEILNNRIFTNAIELGCGEGYLLHNICAKNKLGYDMNPKKVFNDILYFEKDVSESIMGKGDLVICSEVIEHLKDDRKIMNNIYNLLNPKGVVFLSTINNNLDKDKSELDKSRGHYRRYGFELKNRMEQEGFKTILFYPFRSKHYYNSKNNLEDYSIEEDIKQGHNSASGLIYFGEKI